MKVLKIKEKNSQTKITTSMILRICQIQLESKVDIMIDLDWIELQVVSVANQIILNDQDAL